MTGRVEGEIVLSHVDKLSWLGAVLCDLLLTQPQLNAGRAENEDSEQANRDEDDADAHDLVGQKRHDFGTHPPAVRLGLVAWCVNVGTTLAPCLNLEAGKAAAECEVRVPAFFLAYIKKKIIMRKRRL